MPDQLRMKTRLCQQFVNSGRNDAACPHFSRHGWCSYAHGEEELNSAAEPPQHSSRLGKHKFESFNEGPTKFARLDQNPDGESSKLNSARVKTRLCQQFMDSMGDDGACPFFAKNGWCAYAHGEHELEQNAGGPQMPPRPPLPQLPPQASALIDAGHKVSTKLIAGMMKTKLCKQYVDSGGNDEACPHFRKHGWCAYSHDDDARALMDGSDAAFETDMGSSIGDDGVSLEADVRISSKLDQRRMKTRLCQQFLDGGGDDAACLHFSKHGWCAYAHGEHEIEHSSASPGAYVNVPQPPPPPRAVAAMLTESETKVSPKLNVRRMKTRLCQQFLDGGGDDEACAHFAKHGWCAYAHGDHEIEESVHNNAELPEPPRPHVVMQEPEARVSAKLDQRRMKTRMCQQFVDGDWNDAACAHFSKHGWCAYAHGEHEIEHCSAGPNAPSSSRPLLGALYYQAQPMPVQSQSGHDASAKLNQKRMKTRLCKQFVNSGGRDDACPQFMQFGWCAYAHGDHEMHRDLQYMAPSSRMAARAAPRPAESFAPAPQFHREARYEHSPGAWVPPAAREGSVRLDAKRRKTRLCQQFMDGGGDDGACSHFSQHGWCAYAHGEHEIQGTSMPAPSPPARHFDQNADPRNGQPMVSSKLNASRMKTRMCQEFLNGGHDDTACRHFGKHGWCAYAHGEHELG